MIIRFLIQDDTEIEYCISIWQEFYPLQTKDLRIYELFDTMCIGGIDFDLYIEHNQEKHIAISRDAVYEMKEDIIPVGKYQWLIPEKDDDWQLITGSSEAIFEEDDEQNDYNGYNEEDIDDGEVNMSEHMLRGDKGK